MGKIREFVAHDSTGKQYIIEVHQVPNDNITPTFEGEVIQFVKTVYQLPDGTRLGKPDIGQYSLPDGTILTTTDPAGR
jgi:hypothetical protein